MDQTPPDGFDACCTMMVGDVARALCQRNGETPEQSLGRGKAVVTLIMSFLPRDLIEVTLASHCVMFHDLMVASVRDALCAEDPRVRAAEVRSLIALNKAFCSTLGHLRHDRKRAAEGGRDAKGETEAAPRRPTAAPGGAEAVAIPPAKFTAQKPATEPRIAARSDNAAAAAAIRAGDAAGFAKAMGVAQPNAAFLAAAKVSGSPFDPGASGPWPESTRQTRAKT